MTRQWFILLANPDSRDRAREAVGIARRHTLVVFLQPIAVGVVAAGAVLVICWRLSDWRDDRPEDTLASNNRRLTDRKEHSARPACPRVHPSQSTPATHGTIGKRVHERFRRGRRLRPC